MTKAIMIMAIPIEIKIVAAFDREPKISANMSNMITIARPDSPAPKKSPKIPTSVKRQPQPVKLDDVFSISGFFLSSFRLVEKQEKLIER